ncbi:MAG TPA: ketol-acid reductoisomerase, partial [Solirubrobacterales bacterium]|nr:ketol-acid reductoisomerase [Solirubrobacterales bacterium]
SAAEATKAGDLVNILVPDEVQGDLYRNEIKPNLKKGALLLCSHGFNMHFGQVIPPEGVDAALVAPKGPGHLVRAEFEKGAGVPSLVAFWPGASDSARQLALAYAKGIGGTRGGVIETTFEEETETDLFGEQVVLCGGVSALVKAAFETLVEAGYQPELAYFETMHELKLIVDLMYRGGLNFMRFSVSDTAEYGDYVSGPRVTEGAKAAMKDVLTDIQSGAFAAKWIAVQEAGGEDFRRLREQDKHHQIEQVGADLRAKMPFLKPVVVDAGQAQAVASSAPGGEG